MSVTQEQLGAVTAGTITVLACIIDALVTTVPTLEAEIRERLETALGNTSQSGQPEAAYQSAILAGLLAASRHPIRPR